MSDGNAQLDSPWLRAGLYLGAALVVIPMSLALFGIGRASYHVPEGLRGAMQIENKQDQVRFAVSSTSATAILAPLGVLLGVSCGLALRGKKARRGDGGD